MPTTTTGATTFHRLAGGDAVDLTSGLELVTDAPHGLEVPWAHRILFHLFAQSPHMNGHRAGIARELVVPHLVQQLLAGEDLIGTGGQERQQIELFAR